MRQDGVDDSGLGGVGALACLRPRGVHGALQVRSFAFCQASLFERLSVALLLLTLNRSERTGEQLVAHDGALADAVVLGEGSCRELEVAEEDANCPIVLAVARRRGKVVVSRGFRFRARAAAEVRAGGSLRVARTATSPSSQSSRPMA
jgi:hypothetical protein